mgnify:CR=1 FL=1
MNFIVTIILSSFVLSSAFAQEQATLFGAWKGFSDPEIMSSGFTHKLSDLPLSGSAEDGKHAWSGHYWPSQKGGINHRWNSPSNEMFKYKSPAQAEIAKMSLEDLAKLAPSEKYDLLLGQYSYPLKEEAALSANPRAADWAGICHGWAPATLHHAEPTAKVLTNPDGIQIPFGSADIKALLSYYYAFYHETDSTHQMGLRCFFGSWMGGMRGCDDDLNAGAFHIVIANKLGLEKKGLLADVDRFKEVWNQPVVGFKSTILAQNLAPSSSAAKTAVREMKVATELFYVDESDPKWDVVHGTQDQIISKLDLVYRLEINAEGKIVGGEWESKIRPDFLWYKEKAKTFTGMFSRLPELLND